MNFMNFLSFEGKKSTAEHGSTNQNFMEKVILLATTVIDLP